MIAPAPSTAVQPALLVRADVAHEQQSIQQTRASEVEQRHSNCPGPSGYRDGSVPQLAYDALVSLALSAVLQPLSIHEIVLVNPQHQHCEVYRLLLSLEVSVYDPLAAHGASAATPSVRIGYRSHAPISLLRTARST